ncbi:MAG: hypothetical protein WD335_03510 [Candidatus Paceibacterota bacterium]
MKNPIVITVLLLILPLSLLLTSCGSSELPSNEVLTETIEAHYTATQSDCKIISIQIISKASDSMGARAEAELSQECVRSDDKISRNLYLFSVTSSGEWNLNLHKRIKS